MRRLARLAVNVGTGVCVLGLGKAHALADGYAFTGTSRFRGCSASSSRSSSRRTGSDPGPAAHAPHRGAVRRRRHRGTVTVSISVIQLFAGDASLPRAVVFGSALVLVPWYVLCTRVTGDARSRAEDRDRIVLVGDVDEADTLRAELDRAPERHALVAAAVAPADVALVDPPRLPLVELVASARAPSWC